MRASVLLPPLPRGASLTDAPHPSSSLDEFSLPDSALQGSCLPGSGLHAPGLQPPGLPSSVPLDQSSHARGAAFERLAPSAWLSVLGDGSRLELAQRCRERWRARAYLVEPAQLEARSLARLAFELAVRPGTEPGELCSEAIDLAVDDLVRMQGARAWMGGAGADRGELERHLVDELGVEPRSVLARLCAFNACDEAARVAYFACCIEGASIDEHAARRGVARDEVREALRRALGTILGAGEGGKDG